MERLAEESPGALIFVPTSAMYLPAGVVPDTDIIGDADAPVVLHQVNLTKGVDWFRTDRRLLKASLLYVDRVEIAGLTDLVDAARRFKAIHDHYMPDLPPELASKAGGQLGGPGLTWMLDEVDALSGNARASYHDLPAEDAPEALAALEDFRPAIRAGALLVPALETWSFGQRRSSEALRRRLELNLTDPNCVPVVGDRGRWPTEHDALEGTLASRLLGGLEGFPDASIDVILDVRERLESPLIRFRAAVAEAAREISSDEPSDLDAAIADLKKRVVAPAIAEIAEELEALNARSTLLRVASNPLAAGTVAAQLSLAVGAGGTGGLAGLVRGLLAAPAVAAMAKEADYRATKKRALRLRPYWMLHEARVELRKRL
jgi:hypothetical protein